MQILRALGPLAVAAILGVSPAAAAAQQTPDPDCGARAERLSAVEGWLAADPSAAPLATWLQHRLARGYADACVRLDQIQTLGTHNSYHRRPTDALLSVLTAIAPAARAWEYDHRPLAEQFTQQGIRQIELDVYADPRGARYLVRLGPLLSGDPVLGPLALLAPGAKVLHVPHVDFETTCLSFTACLEALEGWSRGHSDHLPVLVLVEAKDGLGPDGRAAPFDTAQLDGLDAEIRSVFGAEHLFTPDDLRGDAATLSSAVLERGWPVLGALRGRVILALDNEGGVRDAYRAGRPALEGRVMFTSAPPGAADAAFIKRNDARGDRETIAGLVSQGYLVRTRADADTEEARSGDRSRAEAALASGAQFVSTDFPVPAARPGFSDYAVTIPGGTVARCNPVSGSSAPGCRDAVLEPGL